MLQVDNKYSANFTFVVSTEMTAHHVIEIQKTYVSVL